MNTTCTVSVGIDEEGALIFSAVKIQQGYLDNPDIVRMCKNRIRATRVCHLSTKCMSASAGGAATPVTDAFPSIIHVGNAGMCRIDCVEMDELGHPMHVVHRGIVQDTEGAGTFREAPNPR
jgi:hypothetical protein